MKIELDVNGIIPFENFELHWRWDDIHNQDISLADKNQIKPLSEIESKRINKVIDYFELESNLYKAFEPTDWIRASSKTKESIKQICQ